MQRATLSSLHRRQFLRFLAGSPLLAVSAPEWSEAAVAMTLQQSISGEGPLITSPDQALNVFEFESVMRQKAPPAHFGYMATGVDDDITLRANRDAMTRFQIRPRRLVDVSRVDTSVQLFGKTWNTPIFLCPVGSQKAFDPDGESASARAAKSKGHLQILSTVSSTAIEAVNAARGEPVWYQLYASSDWRITEGLVKRAEAAGCPALVFTIDLLAGRNTETEERFARLDTRQCSNCHVPGKRKPMFDGLPIAAPGSSNSLLTWQHVKRLKDMTRMKLLIKGIETREDAQLAVEHGADAIIVSNHGGRAQENGRGTIESLVEIVDVVQRRIPVLIDGGFRRGTDIFKALAIGATAVGVGRPYIWGLGAFGQAGVEKVLDILTRELTLIMRQSGVTSLSQITRSYIQDTRRS